MAGAPGSTDSMADAMRRYEREGFIGQFAVLQAGRIECLSCHRTMSAGELGLMALHRFEGDSDPGDEAVLVALECGRCKRKGTLALGYGPEASVEDKLALTAFDDRRGLDPAIPPGI